MLPNGNLSGKWIRSDHRFAKRPIKRSNYSEPVVRFQNIRDIPIRIRNKLKNLQRAVRDFAAFTGGY